jgi:hypothetical protein
MEKTIKLKSIKTNEKYLNNNQDTIQLVSKNSIKNQNSFNQSSNILSPVNGSINTSIIGKKEKQENRVKIKIENVVQKQSKKSQISSKTNKKNLLKSEKSSTENATQILQNNYQQFEKLLNESTKDISNKKIKAKHSGLNSNSINNDIFSINNVDYSGMMLTSVKQNRIL